MRTAGALPSRPCQSEIIRRVPLPSPRTKRPPESSSRSRASAASTSGLRPTPYMIPEPIVQRAVRGASVARVTVAERL